MFRKFKWNIRVLCIGFVFFCSQWANAERSLLSFHQKGELLWQGEVGDAEGRRYCMYVVPGYVPPAQSAERGWSAGGDHLLDYFRPDPYHRIWHTWTNSGTYYRDAFVDRMSHDTARAWSNNFSMASNERERGAFGWYLAYPYAFVKSVCASVFNLTVGTFEAAGTTAWLGLEPAFEFVSPPLIAAWDIGIRGTAWPAIRMGWNTVVTPPLSLIEFVPTPESADGFWVREITSSNDTSINHASYWHPEPRGKNPAESSRP